MAKELYKYEKIYSGKGIYMRGRNPDIDNNIRKKYGHENNGRKFLPIILKYIKPESILDVGCGHNEFVADIRSKRNSIKTTGVDFACKSADIVCPADKLPFKDKSFDLITSFDMLEHIPYDEIDEVLKEFKRVSNTIFVQISLRKSPSTIDGENLHPIVKSSRWWIKKIEEHNFSTNMIMYCKGKAIVPKKIAKRLVVWGSSID